MKSQRLQATTIDQENIGIRLIQRPAVRMATMVVTTQIEATQIEAMTNASAMKLRSTALGRPPPGPPLMA